jgi:polyferredoxin
MSETIDRILLIMLGFGLISGLIALIGMILYNKRILKVDSIRTFSQFFLIISINFTLIGNMYFAPYIPVFRLDLPRLMERGSTRACPMWVIQKSLTTSWEMIALVAVLAVMGVIVLAVGRAGCGWACPYGLWQDVLNKLRNLFRINPKEPPLKVHNFLKTIRFAILFVIIMLAISLGLAVTWEAASGTIFASYLPFGTTRTAPFCAYCPTPTVYYVSTVLLGMGWQFEDPVHYAMWPIIGMLLVGPFLVPRFFCRYLCPQGAMTSLFNNVSLLHIHKEQEKCTKCNACYSHCPMRVELVQNEDVKNRVNDLNCTFCGECVERCYERALSFKMGPLTVYKGGKSWAETQEEKVGGKKPTLKK